MRRATITPGQQASLRGATGITVAPLPRERLLTLDVFRGLTVAGMLLVNDPGSWSAIYPPLAHAAWNGWTPTDLIFPFFIFIVGVTTHLSLEARKGRGATTSALVTQILKRGALIMLCGLLVSAFPYYPGSRWATLRIPGVLQRIGLVYMVGALVTLRLGARGRVTAAAVILLGYWFLMTLVPVPGGPIGALTLKTPSATLSAWVDRAVFGGHLWNQTRTWDPEGLLTSLPAVGTMVLGLLAGEWLDSPRTLGERINGLFAAGCLGTMAGLAWNWVFPINKNLWTSSYVVFTAGVACLTFATCAWLIEVHGRRQWTRPFVIFGINPLLAFMGSEMMARTIYSLVMVNSGGSRIPLETAIYRTAYASWLPPRDASLFFAVTFVALWSVILWALHKRGITIKV